MDKPHVSNSAPISSFNLQSEIRRGPCPTPLHLSKFFSRSVVLVVVFHVEEHELLERAQGLVPARGPLPPARPLRLAALALAAVPTVVLAARGPGRSGLCEGGLNLGREGVLLRADGGQVDPGLGDPLYKGEHGLELVGPHDRGDRPRIGPNHGPPVPEPPEPTRLVRVLRLGVREVRAPRRRGSLRLRGGGWGQPRAGNVEAVDVGQVGEVEPPRRRRGGEEHRRRRGRAPHVHLPLQPFPSSCCPAWPRLLPHEGGRHVGREPPGFELRHHFLGLPLFRLGLEGRARRPGKLLQDLEGHGARLREEGVDLVLSPERVAEDGGHDLGLGVVGAEDHDPGPGPLLPRLPLAQIAPHQLHERRLGFSRRDRGDSVFEAHGDGGGLGGHFHLRGGQVEGGRRVTGDEQGVLFIEDARGRRLAEGPAPERRPHQNGAPIRRVPVVEEGHECGSAL
mmetsp:Transcript_12274/g.28817  ORF Transcript_12274/g.28817 Transcript_12274/m.28817 type:complete len:452 (+) Transcript_12274:144-1499(+)